MMKQIRCRCVYKTLHLILIGVMTTRWAGAQILGTGPLSGPGDPGTIITVAGGQFRDGGEASRAHIAPHAIIADRIGNLYVLERKQWDRDSQDSGVTGYHSRIYKITPDGVIRRYGGFGSPKKGSGDGGPAVLSFFKARGMAIGPDGLLYLLDEFVKGVRRIGQDGTITTVARFSLASTYLTSDNDAFAIDAEGSFYYFNHAPSPRVWKKKAGAPPVALTNQTLDVRDLEVDGQGNLYLTDFPHRILKLTPAGELTGFAGVYRPNGLTFSGDGGPAKEAQLLGPSDMSLDPDGNLYFTDTGNLRVRKVDTSGIITTVAGNGTLFNEPGSNGGDGGPALNASLYRPSGVSVGPDGNVFILDHWKDTYLGRIRKVDASDVITSVIRTEIRQVTEGELALDVSLGGIKDIAFGPDRHLYLISRFSNESPIPPQNRLLKISPEGKIVLDTPLNGAVGDFVLDRSGNIFYVNHNERKIYRRSADGNVTHIAGTGETQVITPSTTPYKQYVGVSSGDGGPAVNAGIGNPTDVALDANGNLYVSQGAEWVCDGFKPYYCVSYAKYREGVGIRKISPDGIISTVWTGEFIPIELKVDTQGDVIFISSEPAHPHQPYQSRGLHRLNTSGALTTYEYHPYGIDIDNSGNLFFLNGGRALRRLSPDGILDRISQHSDTGVYYSGDGGPVADADLWGVNLAIDDEGNLFINSGGLIRKVFKIAEPGLLAGAPFPDRVYLLGDVNRDEGVNVVDAVLVLKHLFGAAPLAGELFSLADMDRNQTLSITDVVWILQTAIGLRTPVHL